MALTLFEPANLGSTLDRVAGAQLGADVDSTGEDKLLAELDRKLARYKSAIDAGADPSVVGEWIA
jgi:hypothetical protein